MVNFQDKKVPILPGVNDVPSTPGQPNHPNDSLLCANYNGLIDDVETELITVKDDIVTLQSTGGGGNSIDTTNSQFDLYGEVFLGNGDDLTDAIKQIQGKVNGKVINLDSNIFPLISVDVTRLQQVPTSIAFFNTKRGFYEESLKIRNGTIEINNTFDDVNFENSNAVSSFIFGKTPVIFQDIVFNITGNTMINLLNCSVYFSNCIFNFNYSGYITDALIIHDSNCTFEGCTFNSVPSVTESLMGVYESSCELNLCNINYNSNRQNIRGNNSRLILINTDNIVLWEYVYGVVLIEPSGNIADYQVQYNTLSKTLSFS